MSKGLKKCSKEQFDRFIAGYKKPLAKEANTMGDPPTLVYREQDSGRTVAVFYVEWIDAPAEYRIWS